MVSSVLAYSTASALVDSKVPMATRVRNLASQSVMKLGCRNVMESADRSWT